jgi:hypothetical protein
VAVLCIAVLWALFADHSPPVLPCWSPRLLVRWHSEIVGYPEGEFRGFVHNRKLTALTQYFSCVPFPELHSARDAIAARVLSFFERIAPKISLDHYIIDFIILPERERKPEAEAGGSSADSKADSPKAGASADDGSDPRILLLELNPFYRHAGAGLFSWRTDRARLFNGPFELRVLAPGDPLPNGDPREQISLQWRRFMDRMRFDRDGNPIAPPPDTHRSGTRRLWLLMAVLAAVVAVAVGYWLL